MILKDVNGKEFNVELKDFMSFTTDAEIERGKGFMIADSEKVVSDIKTEIVDSLGNSLDVKNLMDASKQDKPITCLDVTYEATHSGRNRNYSIYHSDSMEKDMETWMSPFPKPFIKNHDVYTEPLGRVKNFSFSRSDFNPDRDTINVTYRITDMDAIPKFLDGRYKTMSIGGHVRNITCGICGKSILKDNKVKFCGHWKGETYNDQVCLWNCRDIEYVEGSVVNTPADDWAMVKKIVVNPDDTSSSDADDTKTSTDGKDNANMPGSILDKIDELITSPAAASDSAEENPVEGVKDGKTEENPAPDASIEDKDAKIKELEDKIAELETKLTDKEAELTSKDEEITALNDKVTELNEGKETIKEQLIDMASLNKSLMAQRVIDFAIFNGEIKDEEIEVEAKKNELMTKTAVELNDMELSFKAKDVKQTSITPAANPSLVNLNDGVSVADDNKKEEKQVTTLTLKDLEESIVNTFIRPNGYKKEEF